MCVCGNKEHFMLNSWHRLSEAARAKLATMQQAKAEAEAASQRLLSVVVKSSDDTCCPRARESKRERDCVARTLNENSIELTFQLNFVCGISPGLAYGLTDSFQLPFGISYLYFLL